MADCLCVEVEFEGFDKMSEHYTKNTTRVMKFCPTCNKKTMHRVDNGRIGLCVEPHRKDKKVKKEIRSADLF